MSIPRNKELMRIYKYLEMIEHSGSGIPRILQIDSKDSFKFTDNFLRMTFESIAGGQVGGTIKKLAMYQLMVE